METLAKAAGDEMKAQRKTLISVGAIAIALSSACAHAADIAIKAPAYQTPVAPTFSWSGFYFGGHFGYIWGDAEVDVSGATVTPGAATNGVVGGVIGRLVVLYSAPMPIMVGPPATAKAPRR